MIMLTRFTVVNDNLVCMRFRKFHFGKFPENLFYITVKFANWEGVLYTDLFIVKKNYNDFL